MEYQKETKRLTQNLKDPIEKTQNQKTFEIGQELVRRAHLKAL